MTRSTAYTDANCSRRGINVGNTEERERRLERRRELRRLRQSGESVVVREGRLERRREQGRRRLANESAGDRIEPYGRI